MRTPILAVVALVFGLAAAYGTWHYISASKPSDPEYDVVIVKPAKEGDKKKGSGDIPPDTLLKAEMFEVVKKKESKIGELKDQLVMAGVKGRDLEALTNGRRSRTALKAGQPIIFELQTMEPGAQGVQARLKPGEVAATVKTSLDRAGGGLLRPGMVVDVFSKFKDPNSTLERVAILFKDVEVLAVNQLEGPPPEGQPLNPDRVLLRMTYEQALRMTYFQEAGSIHLVMRNPETGKAEIPVSIYDPRQDPLFVDGTKDKDNKGTTAQETPQPKDNGAPSKPPEKQTGDKGPREHWEHIPTRIYNGSGVIEIENKRMKVINPDGTVAPGTATKKAPTIITETDKKDEPKKDDAEKSGDGKKEPGKEGT